MRKNSVLIAGQKTFTCKGVFAISMPFIFAAALFASCAGGGAKEAPPFLSQNYVFTADYVISETEGSLRFKKSGIESCELTFLSPDTMAGMNLVKDGGTATIEFKEMSYELDVSELTRDNPLKALCELLSESNTPSSVTTDKNTGDVKYLYENGSYIIAYSGVPKYIEIPASSISLKITGFES